MPPKPATSRAIAIVLKGYPRLSETFIANEIHAIERAGIGVTIYSLRYPRDTETHPIHQKIRAEVCYLPEYLYQAPKRLLRAWWRCRRQPDYAEAQRAWLQDLRRDPSPNRVRRFGQALVLAAELGEVDLVYAHFLHTPASVARYASILRQLPWACSAHAKDIWTSPAWEKREKLRDCAWLTTCTRANFSHLRALAAQPNKVHLNYHGIPAAHIPKTLPKYAGSDGGNPNQPVRLLSVARAVEKKGYHGLLNALANLPPELHWRLTHIGGGPLLRLLKQQAQALGIAERIQWLGAQSQQVVLEHYRQTDLFVLNSRITADGDRDGLPNVIVEAQAHGVAVLATDISGIPELIQHQVNGVLVPADAESALTDQLQRLIREPKLRQQLGIAGRDIVRQKFDAAENFARLKGLLLGEG